MRIPIYRPSLGPRERANLLTAFDQGWISGQGSFISEFEESFASRVERKHAVAVFNGTVALHLSLHVLGIGPGHEVLTPSYTYIACANAPMYLGAKPVFFDSSVTNLQPSRSELLRVAEESQAVRAVIYPHLFGYATPLDEVVGALDLRKIHVVEDCSEMLGATLGGLPAGRSGVVATYSFFGNKTITTGEGGMVVTDDEELARELRKARNQGADGRVGYYFDSIGFNFRMTNLQAAIGVAQLERLDEFLERKREIQKVYETEILADGGFILGDPELGSSSFWLTAFVVPQNLKRDSILSRMRSDGVDARPGFTPIHLLPHFSQTHNLPLRVKDVSDRVVLLPNFPGMTTEEVNYVVQSLNSAIRDNSR